MTEQEWLAGNNPGTMLLLAHGRATDRKLRLFACACCRAAWNQFVPPVAVGVVAATEAFSDGEAAAEELAQVHRVAGAAAEAAGTAPPDRPGYVAHILRAAAHASSPNAWEAAERASVAGAGAAADTPPTVIGRPSDRTGRADYDAELATQADLLRDIFGNPFRELKSDPVWFTSDVLALARGMYAGRDFSAMPILADALQDAGCDNEELLAHCREAREHVRGCWVVDLLLGKR
jgi:hypothetical protein